MSEACPPNGLSAYVRVNASRLQKNDLAIVCWLNFAIIFYLFFYIIVPANNGFCMYCESLCGRAANLNLKFLRARVHSTGSGKALACRQTTYSQIFVLKRQFIAVFITTKKQNVSKHEYILNETQKSNQIYRNVKKNVMSNFMSTRDLFHSPSAMCTSYAHLQAFHFNLIF